VAARCPDGREQHGLAELELAQHAQVHPGVAVPVQQYRRLLAHQRRDGCQHRSRSAGLNQQVHPAAARLGQHRVHEVHRCRVDRFGAEALRQRAPDGARLGDEQCPVEAKNVTEVLHPEQACWTGSADEYVTHVPPIAALAGPAAR
jgi:hypothetical protein